MTITFTVDFSGAPDADDMLAAKRLVRLENDRRAALVPPGTPLPTGSAAQLKASALTVVLTNLTAWWVSYIAQGRGEVRFTDSELDQIKTNLNIRLNAGESSASIVADTVS